MAVLARSNLLLLPKKLPSVPFFGVDLPTEAPADGVSLLEWRLQASRNSGEFSAIVKQGPEFRCMPADN